MHSGFYPNSFNWFEIKILSLQVFSQWNSLQQAFHDWPFYKEKSLSHCGLQKSLNSLIFLPFFIFASAMRIAYCRIPIHFNEFSFLFSTFRNEDWGLRKNLHSTLLNFLFPHSVMQIMDCINLNIFTILSFPLSTFRNTDCRLQKP